MDSLQQLLSGGEAQRIKLATELSKSSKGKTVYILDEPTTGLHFEDVKKLLEVLQRLVDRGNSVIIIEHNLDVIKTADYIIDIGPEGGDRGGTLVACGTPEEIAEVKESYTATYIRKILKTAKEKEESNLLEVAEEAPVIEITPKKRGRKKKESR